MNASPAATVELGVVGEFVGRLRGLTAEELMAIARDAEDGRATVAGDLEWWRATLSVSRDLRRLKRSRRAALASAQASEAVLAAPGAADAPRGQVVQAARAAGEFARALVAGNTAALGVTAVPGWGTLVRAALAPKRPSAA
jgi:hypothetical protein